MVSSAIVDKYIGESARIVREMFGYAREHQPCVIFMDEVDAIGGRRFSEGEQLRREHAARAEQAYERCLQDSIAVVVVMLGPAVRCWSLLHLVGPRAVPAVPCAGTSADREIQRTLMELLSQLDGFDVVGKVKMIMATNR